MACGGGDAHQAKEFETHPDDSGCRINNLPLDSKSLCNDSSTDSGGRPPLGLNLGSENFSCSKSSRTGEGSPESPGGLRAPR